LHMRCVLLTVELSLIVYCLWQFVGIPQYVSCDNATYFVSELVQELYKRIGCSPRFITPTHSIGNASAERLVGSTKALIGKMANEHPKSWHTLLGYAMWALREVPNEVTGVPPSLLAFGRVPRGPLAILKETWCGERPFPKSLGREPTEYLKELHENLKTAQHYAESHTQREQQRYTDRYNRRAVDKHFSVNDEVLILKPDDSQSRVFSKWRGPAKIVAVKSPYSYIVDYNNARYHLHANHLRRYNVRANELDYTTQIFGGDVNLLNCDPDVDVNMCELSVSNVCSIIHDADIDFGDIPTCGPDDGSIHDLLPSQRIAADSLQHLSHEQQQQLFELIDRYSDVFRDEPGLCTLVQHRVVLTDDFRPRRLKAYRVPERLKPEVEKQIKELSDKGFIRRSTSPMASPLVCVLKGPSRDGSDGVRLAIDYRYINRYTVPDAFPVPEMSEVIQRIGQSKYITVCDAASGFYQTPVHEDDQWTTGFVCGDELWEFTRCPFGMRNSSNTFCRAIQQVLRPIRDIAHSYVDDMAVGSDSWEIHLIHLERFLDEIRKSGITLKLKKCSFGLPEVKFCGQIVGSGKRRPDPEKTRAIENMQVPISKKQIRQILGFYSYFRENIPLFAEIAKPLTDLTAKQVPNKIPWGPQQQKSFDGLKQALIKATHDCLYIVDLSKPFNILVDASDHTVSGVLTQGDDIERPIAFYSQKLNDTQRRWATVEKEAYAALAALKRYKNWIFGGRVVIYSDHNPLIYLVESAPKSAKLMRWSLALQEFEVEFRFRAGRNNVVPDLLTRMVND
jgi:hypothetical protein